MNRELQRVARQVLAIGVLVAHGLSQARVEGAGASFPSQVYVRWAQVFEKETGMAVRYTPTGSGDGVKRITARAVQFGASDTPLSPAELARRQLIQVPMLVGGIVPVVNLPGVSNKRLRLSGPVLAEMMSGRITRWNDAAIVALNPGLRLPSRPIRRLVRSDRSGTTEGFTRYLSTVSSQFDQDVGVSQQPAWTGTVEAAEGNEGMVRALKAQPGSIGYVSFDRAERHRLSTVMLRNAAGQFVAASEDGFRSAIQESDLARRGDDQASLMDRPGPQSWPITMTSFVLFDASPKSGDEAARALSFLYWCFLHGDQRMLGSGFAPLPVMLQSRTVARFRAVKPQDGVAPAYLGER